ncbi:MAG TPA: hypothetical protein VK588_13135 [Chitinophagaceae bacterium]|nr:hypothetical protein [Chitinophagaceae bacterium]
MASSLITPPRNKGGVTSVSTDIIDKDSLVIHYGEKGDRFLY